MKAKITSTVLFLGLTSAVFVPAHATPGEHSPANTVDDSKVYPGSMCVRWSGSNSYYYSWSAIVNSDPVKTLNLDCPVTNDKIAKKIKSGWVYTNDINTKCTLVSSYPKSNGQMGAWQRNPHVISGAGTRKKLKFRTVGSTDVAHYYFSCKVPPGKRLYSYSVTED